VARQRNTEGRLLYAVDEPLPWWMAFFPAPQHVFTMFSGVVIVPMPQAWATYVRTNITMKRWGCVSSVVFLICGVSIAAVGEPLPQQFKVGVILPFSGELASLGQEAKRGMQLALDDLGGAKTPLKLIFADDHRAGTPATVPAAQKLLNVDRVDLGLTLWIEDSRLIAPLFTARKIPLVVLWDSNESIHASGDFVFSNGFSTEAAGIDMASFAAKQLKVKNVAVLRHEDAWAEIISQSFMRQF
jgi:ABC-type branched-subunit amino acid transport system substrate-binding protein